MAQGRIPSLNWLRVFEAAAQLESFSAAARLLNMSPSAISQQIRALETHLGSELFERGPRSVKLTRPGQAFLPTVRQALGSVERTATTLFGCDGKARLTVQANTVFAVSWLAPRLSDFQMQHPDIQLSVTCADQVADFRDDSADVRISFGPAFSEWGETRSLFSEAVYAVAAPDVAAHITSVEDLARQRLVEVAAHRLDWRQFLAHAGAESLPELHVTHASTSVMALTLAASGHGVALARAPATDWLETQLGLTRCLGDIALHGEETYYLVTRSRREMSEAAQAFQTWLLAQTTSA